FDPMLGTHKWSSFLKKPTKKEEDKTSNAFHCKYNTGRWVEKHGWNRVYIVEHWC
ncbi:hypothetical protein BC827DRAFT_1144304, partial [Russula dissimulans]